MTGPSIPPMHIVVTGAAGAVGLAVTRHLKEVGARLALIDRVVPHADNGLFVNADVTDVASMRAAGRRILGGFGHVDAVVHVAGGFEMGPTVHELKRAAWDRMMNVNAWSFVAVAQAFAPTMLKRGSGSLLAISAKVATKGLAGMSAYIASKSALQRIAESMAAEMASKVQVSTIAPGVLDTPANRRAMPGADPATWISTETVAEIVVFLLSPAGRRLSGQHIELN